MKKFYFLILGIVLCGMVAQAQNSYEGHIGFGQHHVVRKGGELNVEVSLDLGAVKLAAQQMIVLTPVLRSTEGEEQQQLAPVVIAGPRRYRVLFSDIGHRPLRHGCAGAKFIRRSYRLRTTPCGPERRGVERGGIP